MNLGISYPWWFLSICVLVGLLMAIGFYYKDRYFSTKLKWLLGVIRFLIGSLITFLLLNPILTKLNIITKKPTIAFLTDNSASQVRGRALIDANAYDRKLQEIINKLKENYNIKQYSYGTSLKDTNKYTYNERGTNLSSAIEEVEARHSLDNLGAIIVTGDGITNDGKAPESVTLTQDAQIYSIGIGDTTIQKDALIAKVYANKIVSLDDQFGVKIDAVGMNCNGASPNISIIHNNSGRQVFNQRINFQGDKTSKQVDAVLKASTSGIQHYTAIISEVTGESNLINNKMDFYVEVLNSKDNILILANSPHPDINAIRSALEKEKNKKIEIKLANNLNGVSLSDYGIIIAHNLPSQTSAAANSLLAQASNAGVGVFYIVGGQTNLVQFNQVQKALNISSGTGGLTDATAQWIKEFNYFTVNPDDMNKIASLPPVQSPYGQYKIGGDAQTLLTQRIGTAASPNPLLLLQQSLGQRVAVFSGEGLWRWRIYNYTQQNNFDAFDGLMAKVIQFLSVKQDKKKFRVHINKNIFNINETIAFDAEIYNDNFELINAGNVSLTLVDQNSKRYNYSMNKLEKNFTLNLKNLPAGNYTYEGKSLINGVSKSEIGNFKVVDIDVETGFTKANFSGMKALAEKHNGKFLFANEIGKLYDYLSKNDQIKPIIREEKSIDSLINWRWILGLIIGLLGLEWLLRKLNGNL